MSFVDAIKSCFSQYVGFTGRARRSEFWFFYLFECLIGVLFSILLSVTHYNTVVVVLYVIVCLALLLPGLAVMIRRLQDTGRKWTYIFMGLIPVAGSIILIVNCAKDSEPGTNAYGPNPKGV